MRRWLPQILVLSAVVALAPCAQASRVIKANVSAPTAAPGHWGVGGPVVVDSPLGMDSPSLGGASVLPALAPAISEADKPGLKARVYAKEIQGRSSAGAAARFLEDGETRSWLRANAPARHRALFQAAAGINDLRLTLSTYEDPDTLRLALLARSDFPQAASPQAMRAWIDSDPGLEMYRARVSAAFWEWETLNAFQKDALAQNRVTPEQWGAVSLDVRRQFLRSAGRRLLAGAGVGTVPRSPAEAAGQKNALHGAWGALDNDERHTLNEKLEKSLLAFEKLKKAHQALSGVFKPGLREALARAEVERDPDKALHALRAIFDGMGETKEVRRIAKAASPQSGQAFTPTRREALARFLGKHLLDEIAPTQAGGMLLEFYKSHPLRLTVSPLVGARFAQYDPKADQIDFNESMVTEFLRGRGLTLEQLFKDGEALRDLVGLMAPSFVHEATHQTQFQALVDRGVPPGTEYWYDSTLEVEAFSRQTLYTHEMARTSERHRLLFIEGQNLLGATRSDVQRAQLLRDNPSAFRGYVLGGYAQVKSLSGMAHTRLASAADIAADREARRIVGAELARRARLPHAERESRERNGIDLRAWSAQGSVPVDQIKTGALRRSLQYRSEDQDWVYDVYDYLRDRYTASIRGVMTRLGELYPNK